MGRGGYGEISFWSDYYVEDRPEPYDWFFSFAHLRPALERLMAPADDLLLVGCGNAPVSAELHAAGYTRQVNIDNCPLVIEQQRHRAPHLDWQVQDVRAMDFPDGRFDVVLDKGLLDNLLCYLEPENNVFAGLRDMRRVLKDGGCYVLVSCHPPEELETFLGDRDRGGAWRWHLFRLRNPRFPEVRVPAYTLVVAEKPPAAAGAARPPPFRPSDLTGLRSGEDGQPIFLAPNEVAAMQRRADALNAASRAKLHAQQQAAAAAAAAATPPPPSLADQLRHRRGSLRRSFIQPRPVFPVLLGEDGAAAAAAEEAPGEGGAAAPTAEATPPPPPPAAAAATSV